MKAPSHLELMMLTDGELDDVRAAEIMAWLAEHPEDGAVVRALGDVGAAIQASTPRPEIDVTADVMAAIARLDEAEKNARLASTPPPSRIRTIRPRPSRGLRISTPVAAIVLGSVVAAAAAALFFAPGAAREVPLTGPVASLALPSTNEPQDDESQSPPGTAVDAVDFGGHQGAIFYVRGGASTSTLVVWVTEEPPR